MSYHYYKTDRWSKTGKNVYRFHEEAMRCARRADEFAQKCGATGYVLPFDNFEGGVDYLEFDKEPDMEIWRLALTTPEGIKEYEPNCMVRADVLIIPDDRFQPSDTWNTTYDKHHLTWEQAKKLKPRETWLEMIKKESTGDKQKDDELLNKEMQSKSFVPMLIYFGLQDKVVNKNTGKAQIPWTLRRAIKIERERLKLPVLQVEPLFVALGIDIPADNDERKVWLSNCETPAFFRCRDTYYIRCACECKAEGLHAIDGKEYMEVQAIALKEEE